MRGALANHKRQVTSQCVGLSLIFPKRHKQITYHNNIQINNRDGCCKHTESVPSVPVTNVISDLWLPSSNTYLLLLKSNAE